MPNVTLNELKQMPKMRCVKSYKNMSKERLLSSLGESEYNSIEHNENNFNNARKKRLQKILVN